MEFSLEISAVSQLSVILGFFPDKIIQHPYIRHSFGRGTSCRVGEIIGSALNQLTFLLTSIQISGFNIQVF